MAIQISTNDIDTDGFFTTTFTGDDTGQRLKGRIRCPRQGRPVVDYFYVSVSDPGAATATTDSIRDRDGVAVYLSGDVFRRFFHQMTSAIRGSSDSYEDFICLPRPIKSRRSSKDHAHGARAKLFGIFSEKIDKPIKRYQQ